MRRSALATLALCALATDVAAHEVRPAYLELRQTSDERYEVLWKVPARGEGLRLGIDVELPAACTDAAPRRRELAAASVSERWTTSCPQGLAGRSIAVPGLAATLTDALVRVVRLDGSTQIERLVPAAPAFTVAATPSRWQVAATYTGLGVEHILLGVDHLLFVGALLLLVRGRRRLVATVTAFTVAHSLTLAAATLGWLRVPGPPVEAAIALSIVFVAAEIVRTRQDEPSLAARRPWIVAFGFGLLHGLGFAGALAEVGLPERAIPTALLFFNLGVELGQLAFIGAALALAAAARRLPLPPAAPWARWAPPYAIGGIAAFWLFERLAAF
jgi:hydrogenase/urease accessory protein HupE